MWVMSRGLWGEGTRLKPGKGPEISSDPRNLTVHHLPMPSEPPTPLSSEPDRTDCIADGDTATSVAESVLADVTSNAELEPTKVTCALPKLARPSFIFTYEHISPWQNNSLPFLSSPRLSRATYDNRYAIAAKRAGVKPWAKSSRLKKQRPRWTFTLDSGLALEGVPLTHSGVSNLMDGIDLKVEAV